MISCSAGEAVRWEDAQGNILQWESPSPAFLKLLWHDERRPDATPKPTGHVVLVENRDTLLHLPTRLPAVLSGALVAHYEGWLSERLLALLVSWESAKIWLLPDLDPVGLARPAHSRSLALCGYAGTTSESRNSRSVWRRNHLAGEFCPGPGAASLARAAGPTPAGSVRPAQMQG